MNEIGVTSATMAVFLACALSLVSCNSGGGGTTCGRDCYNAWVADEVYCYDANRDCLLECTGDEDEACVNACYDTEYWSCVAGLESQLEVCLMDCPCYPEFMVCASDCDDALIACEDGCAGDWTCEEGCEDAEWECFTGCSDTLASCSGWQMTEAGHMCMEECGYYGDVCAEDCWHAYGGSSDWTTYVNCDHGCRTTMVSCKAACF